MSFLVLKTLHVSAVALSAAGFVIRGVLVWRQSPLAERAWLRWSAHAVDTGN